MLTSAMGQPVHKSLSEILQGLQAEDTELKGKALETLAFYFIRQLGLKFKAWRKRNKESDWAEIEAIAQDTHLVFTRWQIQCKNAPNYKITEDDNAIQVGLSLRLKSNIILMVTTGQFTLSAQSYIEYINQTTYLNVITLDKEDLRALAASSLVLVKILNYEGTRNYRTMCCL